MPGWSREAAKKFAQEKAPELSAAVDLVGLVQKRLDTVVSDVADLAGAVANLAATVVNQEHRIQQALEAAAEAKAEAAAEAKQHARQPAAQEHGAEGARRRIAVRVGEGRAELRGDARGVGSLRRLESGLGGAAGRVVGREEGVEVYVVVEHILM